MYNDITLGFEFEVESDSTNIDNPNIHSCIYAFIDKVYNITGLSEHRIDPYHDKRDDTAKGKWRIEYDNSIVGAEFISPVMKYAAAKKMVKLFFKAIAESPTIKITDSCGLHVGMSINGDITNVNLSKLLSSINQKLLVSLWRNRAKTDRYYCKNITDLMRGVDLTTLNYKNIAIQLIKGSHGFIKLNILNGCNYIELRVPGGKDYHLKYKELFVTIDHVASKMLQATKKDSNKKYVSKMLSYVNRVNKRNVDNSFANIEMKAEFLKSERHITNHNITSMFNSCIYAIEEKTLEYYHLNDNFYLYFLIKYIVKSFNLRNTINIKNYSHFFREQKIQIAIPPEEFDSEKIKILEHWRKLPLDVVTDLFLSLNNYSYKYLLKYKKDFINYLVKEKGVSILKQCGILNAYKYNKVK